MDMDTSYSDTHTPLCAPGCCLGPVSACLRSVRDASRDKNRTKPTEHPLTSDSLVRACITLRSTNVPLRRPGAGGTYANTEVPNHLPGNPQSSDLFVARGDFGVLHTSTKNSVI